MKEKISKYIIAFTIILAIAGGVFFGLFSCGGYVWHKQIFALLFIGLMALILLAPLGGISKLWKKALLVVATSLLFILVRAGASAFYPATPESLAEFLSSLVRGIQFGPC